MLGDGRPFVMEILRPQRDHPTKEELLRAEDLLTSQDQ
jgi:tRNA U54 and U55 pseudouridine synthase Pus10